MKVLCVHHKGGVGKTTTAIHITGVFLGSGFRVLLIDGDSQADSFKFFSEGSAPKPGGERLDTQEDPDTKKKMLTIVSERNDDNNATRWAENISKLANDQKFQQVVIDIATDLPNISKILMEIKPDMVLVGVKRDDIGSFVHLNDMLLALDIALPVIGSPLCVKIVPIGVKEADFKHYVKEIDINYEIMPPVDWVPNQAGTAVFIDYEYLWNKNGCEHLWDYYKQVAME